MNAPDIAPLVYKVIKYGIIFGLGLSFIVLVIGSLLVHDTHYIEKNPRFFLSETLLMGILTGLPVIYISWLRKVPIKNSIEGFSLFFLKIILIHIGFQLSGVYTVLFPLSGDLDSAKRFDPIGTIKTIRNS
jgi:hypothetical protein